jgi:hypothetical protein
VVRAQGAVHALVVARDHRVALDVLQPVAQLLAVLVHRDVGLVVARDHRVVLDVLQPVAQLLAVLVHRDVGLVVARALRERALVQVQGGLARQHASVRHRRAR